LFANFSFLKRGVNSVTEMGHPSFCYQLTVELNNGDFVETVCRVVVSETANGEAVQSFKFDSDEFQKAVMLGKIDVRAICAAIEEFHSQPD
jgi:hypothetical protein